MLPEAQGVAPNFLHLLGGLERYALKNDTAFRNDGTEQEARSAEHGVGEIGGRRGPLQLLMFQAAA